MLWLDVVGLTVPQVGTASAGPGHSEAKRQVAIVDVALTQGNLLCGQLVNVRPKSEAA